MGHQQQPNALNLDLDSDFDPSEARTRATPQQDQDLSRTDDKAQRPTPLESGIPAPPSNAAPRTESGLRPRAIPESEQSIADLDAGWEEIASEPPPPISPLPPLPFDLYGESEPPTQRRESLESSEHQVVASAIELPLDDALNAATQIEPHPADGEGNTVQRFVFSDIGDLDYDLDPTANVPSEWMDHLAQNSARRPSENPPAVVREGEAPHPADLDEGAVTSTMSALHPSILMERERFEQDRAQSESPTIRPPSLPLGDLEMGLRPIPRARDANEFASPASPPLVTMGLRPIPRARDANEFASPASPLPPIPRPSPLGPLATMIHTAPLPPTPIPPPPSSTPYAVFVPPPSSSHMLAAGGVGGAVHNPNVPAHLRRGRPITWRPGRPEPAPKPVSRPLRPTTRFLILVTIAIEVGIILAVLWRLLK